MNKNYTLKELADIGAKEAIQTIPHSTHMCVSDFSITWHEHELTRQAFTKAILSAIGYELPKDEEREAFERWLAEQGDGFHPCGDVDKAFLVWKAGREELRQAQMTAKEPIAEIDLGKSIGRVYPAPFPQNKTEPAWIPWEGGECPLADTVKRWEVQFRTGKIDDCIGWRPSDARWAHRGWDGDIVAYRVLEG